MVKNARGLSFLLKVVKHITHEEDGKLPQYIVALKLVDPLKQGTWSFKSEDAIVFDEFPIGQEFTLNALFEQQKISA